MVSVGILPPAPDELEEELFIDYTRSLSPVDLALSESEKFEVRELVFVRHGSWC